MTRALILGCGYLGLRLARAWFAEGDEVHAVTRSPRRAADFATEGIAAHVGDVGDPKSLALPEVDVVVWAVGFDRSAGVPMRRVYFEGLGNALAALPGTPRIVLVSSTGVYGQTDGSEVDERSPTHPREESGRVVLEAEALLQSRRPDATIARFAGIYGPGRLLRAKDLLAGTPLAVDPEKWLNLIHVEDGVRAVQAICKRGSPGEVYNVCDDRPARRREFYARLAERIGAPPPRFVPPTGGDEANRRIVNRRLRYELGVELAYPSFEEGLAASTPPPT
jgi:nucleoside-diphosphate-sugar epimerase